MHGEAIAFPVDAFCLPSSNKAIYKNPVLGYTSQFPLIPLPVPRRKEKEEDFLFLLPLSLILYWLYFFPKQTPHFHLFLSVSLSLPMTKILFQVYTSTEWERGRHTFLCHSARKIAARLRPSLDDEGRRDGKRARLASVWFFRPFLLW